MKYKAFLSIIASFLLVIGLSPVRVQADEIAVTGNGSESVNTAQNTSSTQTTITQNNDSTINNSVTTTSNTGNNSASDNTGSTNITTGNASTTTEIQNGGNVSTVNQNCCPQSGGSSTTISGNGSGSINGASSTTNNQTTVSVTQNATINNIINGIANTGNNSANYNTGNVSIKTGNLSAYQEIVNGPLNIASVHIPDGSDGNESIKIVGNGANSENSAYVSNHNNKSIYISNNAYFVNDVTLRLNTGGNSADVNVGNVDIATGDIIATTKIKNVANISDVTVTCCQKAPEKPVNQPGVPAPTTTTVTSSSPTTSGGSSSPSTGAVLAAAAGRVLPATGGNFVALFILGNILMMFMGVYLRLRSGRSPSFFLASF